MDLYMCIYIYSKMLLSRMNMLLFIKWFVFINGWYKYSINIYKIFINDWYFYSTYFYKVFIYGLKWEHNPM